MLSSLKNKIFSNEEVNTGRQIEFDIAKIVFVIFVALVHVTVECVGDKEIDYGIPYVIDTIIGGPIISPGLMFAMGACMVYGKKHGGGHFIRRGIFLFVMGFVLNFFRYTLPFTIGYLLTGDSTTYFDRIIYYTFNNDILQCAGMVMFTLGIFIKLKFKESVILGIALASSIFATLINGIDFGNDAMNIIMGYFIGTEDAAEKVMSYFVFMNWLPMASCGYVYGKKLRFMKDKDLFYKIVSPVCLIIMAGYYTYGIKNETFMFAHGEYDFYHIATKDVLICIVTAFALDGIYYFIGKRLPKKVIGIVQRIGADMPTFYFTHWILISICIYIVIFPIRKSPLLPGWAILLISVVVTIIALILADFLKCKTDKTLNGDK